MTKLPPDLHHRLKVAAAERSMNMNDLVCAGIEQCLAELVGPNGRAKGGGK